jgi:hypothetical protein
MKKSRTFPVTPKNIFKNCFVGFGFAIIALTLMPFPLNGAQYYTNWAAVYFTSNPAQGDPLADPDSDGEPNVVEFAFGTNPTNSLAGGGITGCVQPLYGGVSGTNAVFQVEILEREGHQPGVQIDLYLSSRLKTNWFRPWWLRTATNSLPSDPAGSVRELFTTRLPGTNVWFVRPRVQLIEGGAETAKYYMATNGSDGYTGTSNAPFATLVKVASMATNGTLVYIRGGRYALSSKATFSNSGSAGKPIRIRAYPGETPVLDFSAQTGRGSSYDAVAISGNYYWFYGLVFTNAGHNSISITGTNNIVERCVSLGARDTGFHIGGSDTTTYAPASNLVLNCESIRSYDPPANGNTGGGNADGFAAKWILGLGNVFSGCRSLENSDDGWDLWMGTQRVLITNCWSFRSGTNVYWDAATNTTFAGNGNGFKLGGNNIGAPHILIRCLSFGNRSHGVDQNNNLDSQTVDQNTVWGNGIASGKKNYYLNHGANTNAHIVRNNISFAGYSSDGFTTGTLSTNNSWSPGLSLTVSTNDFLSADFITWAMGPRRDDGGLPETPFMHPVPTGRLVNKGTYIGESYVGSAPDLGAYETTTW